MKIYEAKFDEFSYNFISTKIRINAKLSRMVDFHNNKKINFMETKTRFDIGTSVYGLNMILVLFF